MQSTLKQTLLKEHSQTLARKHILNQWKAYPIKTHFLDQQWSFTTAYEMTTTKKQSVNLAKLLKNTSEAYHK